MSGCLSGSVGNMYNDQIRASFYFDFLQQRQMNGNSCVKPVIKLNAPWRYNIILAININWGFYKTLEILITKKKI